MIYRSKYIWAMGAIGHYVVCKQGRATRLVDGPHKTSEEAQARANAYNTEHEKRQERLKSIYRKF